MTGQYLEGKVAAVAIAVTGTPAAGLRTSVTYASDWASLATHTLSRAWTAHPVVFALVALLVLAGGLVLGTLLARVLRTDVPLTARMG